MVHSNIRRTSLGLGGGSTIFPRLLLRLPLLQEGLRNKDVILGWNGPVEEIVSPDAPG